MTRQEKEQHLNEDKGLIHFIALKHYKAYRLELEDAIQYCFLAYWTGLDLWDVSKGTLSAFMGVRLQQRLKIEGKKERAIKGVRDSNVSVVTEAEGWQPNNLKTEDTPETLYFRQGFLRDMLDRVLVTMSSRDQEIVRGYYFEDKTCETLAEQYNVSSQRIVQILAQVKSKLKGKIL